MSHRGVMSKTVIITVATLLLATGLAGCSDQPAVCDSVDELRASVDNLKDINLSENGLGEISDSLSAIEDDVRQVASDAKGEFSDQVDQVDADFTELGSSVDAARQDTSASTLGAVGAAVSTLGDDVEALVDDVSSTC